MKKIKELGEPLEPLVIKSKLSDNTLVGVYVLVLYNPLHDSDEKLPQYCFYVGQMANSSRWEPFSKALSHFKDVSLFLHDQVQCQVQDALLACAVLDFYSRKEVDWKRGAHLMVVDECQKDDLDFYENHWITQLRNIPGMLNTKLNATKDVCVRRLCKRQRKNTT